MTKKVSIPTKPFKPTLILRCKKGVIDRYKSMADLQKDMWLYSFSMSDLYNSSLTHGHFRRSSEEVAIGRNAMASLSLRWCTGEPALEEIYAPAIFVMDRKPRKGRKKSWISKKRHKRFAYRNDSCVCRIQRYGKAQMASEGEPPVRRWKDAVPEPYDDWYDRTVSRSWKDQSKCRKQWQKNSK